MDIFLKTFLRFGEHLEPNFIEQLCCELKLYKTMNNSQLYSVHVFVKYCGFPDKQTVRVCQFVYMLALANGVSGRAGRIVNAAYLNP
jgi:hypothetical protein